MDDETTVIEKNNKKLHTMYVLSFLMSVSVAIPAYINSTFLSTFVSEKSVGIIFSVASLLSILTLALLPKILKHFHNIFVTISTLVTLIGVLVIFAFVPNMYIVISIFTIYLTALRVLWVNMDLLLESFSSDKNTGEIRGAYLTIASMGWVISPTIAGALLTNGDYWKIYLTSAVVLLPVIFILYSNFNKYRDPVYIAPPFWKTLNKVRKLKNIRSVFMVSMMLRFFYSWMIIYTPIYLTQYMGFEWRSIGLMFTIMLLPFVFLEYPVGRMADKWFGEKEIMTLGFFIIIGASIVISFISSQLFWVWAIVLMVTRVGASMVEITSETYFFKQIAEDDSDILGVFRMTQPLAYLIGPAIASVALYFVDMRHLFLLLGIIMLWGVRYSIFLKDTK